MTIIDLIELILKSLPKNLIARKQAIVIAIPLALSAFTHLFNPIGFPSIDHDEGHYMRRAMEVLNGLGPQESKDVFPNPIDHPYFGQIFLAGTLRLVGYPGSLDPSIITKGSSNTSDAVNTTEMLWLVPRALVGLLAVVDTFLIYKIAERRYNNKTIALIASILFGVMPLSWMTRRIFLESIQLPLILSSILAAVYLKDSKRIQNAAVLIIGAKNSKTFKITSLVLLSGIFLGLAIFTKVPAFTMIPVIGFFVYTNTNAGSNDKLDGYSKRLLKLFHLNTMNIKMLGLWFIPVILIPLIWPLYSISVGYSFDYWLDRVIYQASRLGQAPLVAALNDSFIFDPVFIILGFAGLIYAVVIKREYFLLLWAIPFLIFLYKINWVMPFHLVPLFPLFSIAAAVLIVDVSNIIGRKKRIIVGRILPLVTISGIAIFGLVSTIMIITTNINSSFFEVSALVAREISLTDNDNDNDNSSSSISSANDTSVGSKSNINSNVILLGPHPVWSIFWIPRFVLNETFSFRMVDAQHGLSKDIKNAKVLMISDSRFVRTISKDVLKQPIANLRTIYLNTNPLATFQVKPFPYNTTEYPYTNLDVSRGYGWWNTSYKIQLRISSQATAATTTTSSPYSSSLSTATTTGTARTVTTPAVAEKLSDAVNITAPNKGEQVSVGKDLKVSGKSIDNSTSTCSILVNLNGIKPNQNAAPAGPNGSNDYSKWNALLTSKYSSVKEGNNKVNARINCSDIKGLASHFNVRSSVSVVGVP
ncbi:MAG TPA: hypothetical protein VJ729_03135 [Nitrososphaeraceae archaeon]|nr:hypothetical protein [Nitrososphaeraceae archaeon]